MQTTRTEDGHITDREFDALEELDRALWLMERGYAPAFPRDHVIHALDLLRADQGAHGDPGRTHAARTALEATATWLQGARTVGRYDARSGPVRARRTCARVQMQTARAALCGLPALPCACDYCGAGDMPEGRHRGGCPVPGWQAEADFLLDLLDEAQQDCRVADHDDSDGSPVVRVAGVAYYLRQMVTRVTPLDRATLPEAMRGDDYRWACVVTDELAMAHVAAECNDAYDEQVEIYLAEVAAGWDARP